MFLEKIDNFMGEDINDIQFNEEEMEIIDAI